MLEPARARRSRATRGAIPVADGLPSNADDHRTRYGQSLIETCLAVGLIGLLFMGMLQVALLFSAREVLYHAAARGARARTVGFNRWMVRKSVRVAAIPNAGRMTAPDYANVDAPLRSMVATMRPGELWTQALRAQPVSARYLIEQARIPNYLDSHNLPRADQILDYADWDTIRITEGLTPGVVGDGTAARSDALRFRVEQAYPLWRGWHRAFYAAERVDIAGESRLENHYPLYIDDRLW